MRDIAPGVVVMDNVTVPGGLKTNSVKASSGPQTTYIMHYDLNVNPLTRHSFRFSDIQNF